MAPDSGTGGDTDGETDGDSDIDLGTDAAPEPWNADEVAPLRGLDAESFVPKGMLNAYRESERGPAPAPEEVA